jgi:hypothetical protein
VDLSADLHLTIDRLVLRGFAPGERAAVVAGFRAELARALAARDAGAAFGASRTTNAIAVPPRRADAAGAAAGEAAARQLLKGLRR